MSKFQAVVADFVNDELGPEHEILGDIADVAAIDAYGEDDFIARVPGDTAAIMLYHNLAITQASMDHLPNLKIVARCGVGYDNVDREYAKAQGILVTNVPDYGTEEVADSAIGHMLALTRGIAEANSLLQRGRGKWSYEVAPPRHRLRGKTFAVLGLGRIGTATALRAKGHGMDVVFYDPYLPDGMDKALGIRRADTLGELLNQAFVLSLHCLLSDETRNIVDAEAIAQMPKGSFLVNTSRGQVVDISAIPTAIESGHLAGAAIDVLPEEPPGDDNALVAAWRDANNPCYERVIINPHSAFYCEEGLVEMRYKASKECRRALLGEPVRNQVNA